MANHRRTAARVAGLVMSASIVLVAGCSAGGLSTSQGTDGAELDAKAQEFLANRGKELGTSSISVLAQNSPQANAVQEIAGQFTELTGIDVEFTILDEQSTENRAAVALGSSSGGYDLVQTPSGFIPSYSERGWIEPLDDLIADEDTIVPGWSVDAFGEGTTALLEREDHLYGVPMFIGTQVFHYRTDLFEKAGIEHPPETYEELIAAAEAIDSDDVAGIALRTAPSASQLLFVWSAWLYANGGSYYSSYDEGEYSGAALNSPEALESLKQYIDLVQNDAPSGATNWSVDDVTRAFMTGRVGIVQEGIVFGGSFNDPDASTVAGDVDTFTLPAGPAGTYVPYNAHGWSIASNSANTEAAWLFAQWATLPETLVAASDTDANFGSPPIADVYSSSEYQERYGYGNFVDSVQETIDTANEGGVSPLEGDPNYLPATTEWATVGQQISEELSKAVTGQISPEAALEKAASYLE